MRPVSGEGADATVKVSIDHRAVLLEEPVDMGYPLGTSAFLQGLESQGKGVAQLVLHLCSGVGSGDVVLTVRMRRRRAAVGT